MAAVDRPGVVRALMEGRQLVGDLGQAATHRGLHEFRHADRTLMPTDLSKEAVTGGRLVRPKLAGVCTRGRINWRHRNPTPVVSPIAMTPSRISIVAVLELCVLATTSCEATDRPVERIVAVPPLRRVDIVPATATMMPGDTVRFRATAAPAIQPDLWTWTSSDTAALRVDGTGLARALLRTTGVAVCAAAVVDPGIKACATIVIPAVP